MRVAPADIQPRHVTAGREDDDNNNDDDNNDDATRKMCA